MLRLENVYKRFRGGKKALDDINLNLEQGEMAFVTGHSGAGKSTLLKVVAMLDRHTQGNIFFNNFNLRGLKTKDVPFYRRQLGLIFQDPHLLPNRTIFNNVALPLIIAGSDIKDITRKVHAALDKVQLKHKEDLYPMELSDGEKQRACIARALVHKPSLILADEPTGNLDPELSYDIMNVFQEINMAGASVLIVTHDIDLIDNLPYRRFHLNQGQLVGV